MNFKHNFQVPRDATAVTEHDTNMLPAGTVALYIGVGGDAVVDMEGGTANVTFVGVPTGTTLVGRFVRLKVASTVASVVALHG